MAAFPRHRATWVTLGRALSWRHAMGTLLAMISFGATVHAQQSSSRPEAGAAAKDDNKPEEVEESMVGKVTKVIDGDSIRVRPEGEEVDAEIQLEGTDAPELKQPYGDASREALAKRIMDQEVRLTWVKKDNFGRRLAQVYLKDEHINATMIRDGHSWHFKRYNQSPKLAALETEAKDAKRGLWGTEKPMAPWDWRKENRSPDKPDR